MSQYDTRHTTHLHAVHVHVCVLVYIYIERERGLKLVVSVGLLKCIVTVDFGVELCTQQERTGHLSVQGVALVRRRSQAAFKQHGNETVNAGGCIL